MNTVTDVIKHLKDLLEKNLNHTLHEFTRIRAGKASPAMLDSVMVEYYGALTPLNQVANVNTPDSRTLSIQPYDKTLIKPIETAIVNSNLGFAPSNDGDFIRISIPPITEERRKDLVKMAKAEAENSKVGIRNIRKDSLDRIKKLKTDGLSEDEAKGAEEDIQRVVDGYIKKTDESLVQKEKEILTV
ncbi:MAG: ribosome recycling factor [Bacteroidetes bacterium]|nr:ribosome recycling factor [Bacteroidota bacterium]